MGTMTIFQFIGLRTCRLGQQLVAETDAHARLHLRVIQERADVRHRLLATLRIARTVGQEKTVEVKLIEIIVPRHAHHLDAALDEAADDIRLHAAIHEDHLLKR